jgi:hypothetical protein
MRPYIEKHLQELRERIQDETLIMTQHKLHFIAWLKDLNIPVGEIAEEKMIYLLAAGAHSVVKSWQAYDINGFTFYTNGFNEEIGEVNYGMSLQIPVFKCQWVKHPHDIEVDEYEFTIVDLRNVGHKDESWVLASTVAQVFYILDPRDEKKPIVVPSKQRVVRVDNMEDEEEYNQFEEVPFFVDTTRIVETKISYSNVISYARTDGEGNLVHV